MSTNKLVLPFCLKNEQNVLDEYEKVVLFLKNVTFQTTLEEDYEVLEKCDP